MSTMSSNFHIHDSLRLHITASYFYINASSPEEKEILIIDRVTNEIRLSNNEKDVPHAGAVVKSIQGIIGIIRLLGGPYLVVITRKEKVGEINDKAIWKITSTDIIPYKKNMMHLNEQQQQDNLQYEQMLRLTLATEGFYYSTTYDLTHSMQRLYNTSPEFKQIPLHERVDSRFMWNSFILKDLTQQSELSAFCLPIMFGFISIQTCKSLRRSIKYTLISRRSCFRAGTRYNIRGADAEGHVANYVETEQIIESEFGKSSFIQTRGSVPFIWSQLPCLKYKPLPIIKADDKHVDAFQRHFADQTYNYGENVIVNLLDQKGAELKLVDMYDWLVRDSKNNKINHVAFDFHKECRKLQWHRLSVLMDRLDEDQKRFGYFMVQEQELFSSQIGVFRTNCIDCLDRTNVVQSMLAKQSLMDQLVKLELLSVREKIENYPELDTVFRNTWANNADALAVQYAGTGALKTDFTRTGKRTIIGTLRDGYYSAKRYILNNFYDGFRQDALDLFLGNYEVEAEEGITIPSALKFERDWKFYALPVIFVVAFSMCVTSILQPWERLSEYLSYIVFWGCSSIAGLFSIFYFGTEFVDRPRLAHKKSKRE